MIDATTEDKAAAFDALVALLERQGQCVGVRSGLMTQYEVWEWRLQAPTADLRTALLKLLPKFQGVA